MASHGTGSSTRRENTDLAGVRLNSLQPSKTLSRGYVVIKTFTNLHSPEMPAGNSSN